MGPSLYAGKAVFPHLSNITKYFLGAARTVSFLVDRHCRLQTADWHSVGDTRVVNEFRAHGDHDSLGSKCTGDFMQLLSAEKKAENPWPSNH